MTKKHFEHAASIIRAILAGEWTNEWPIWAVCDSNGNYQMGFIAPNVDNYTRAVQTAEAFIILFQAYNPRFSVNRFLVACGLAEKPEKKRR